LIDENLTEYLTLIKLQLIILNYTHALAANLFALPPEVILWCLMLA